MSLPYNIVIFDIDNTLTESRSKIDARLATLLSKLIDMVPVALISGGSLDDFQSQVISHLSHVKKENLYVLPTTGSELFTYKNNTWTKEYSHPMNDYKRRLVFSKLAKVLAVPIAKLDTYIYDRGTQITYSALGKHATLLQKYAWDPTKDKRREMIERLKPELPGLSITIGGSTSIDFTEEGVNKAFGVSKLLKHLNISADKVLFIGDALDSGGNDEPVKTLGIATQATKGPQETISIIENLTKSA